MKKWKVLLFFGLVLFSITGCMSLFTALNIEPPVSAEASMLVLEAEDGETGGYLVNNNATGWAPLIEDENGAIIPFKMVGILANVDTIYFAENLKAGTYTLKGFRHVYTDYGLLPDNVIPSYEPYVDEPYHIRQEFMLDKPVVIHLKAAQMESFGKYSIHYKWVGGAAGTTDDRWKARPDSVKITGDSKDRNALQVLKGFTNANWAPWNERNAEVAK